MCIKFKAVDVNETIGKPTSKDLLRREVELWVDS